MQFFDRFLSEVEIGVEQLQVAALVCIWTASKMHEQRVVRSKDIEKYFGSFATAAECRVLELKLLVKGLHWNTASFTPIAFIRRLLHCLMPWSEAAAALSAVQPLIRLVETGECLGGRLLNPHALPVASCSLAAARWVWVRGARFFRRTRLAQIRSS